MAMAYLASPSRGEPVSICGSSAWKCSRWGVGRVAVGLQGRISPRRMGLVVKDARGANGGDAGTRWQPGRNVCAWLVGTSLLRR